MKKIIAIVAAIFVVLWSFKMFDGGYESGNTTGYDNGYEDGYEAGYEWGYIQAEDEYNYYGWLEEEGIHYARKYSEWSPEEAMYVIRAYQDNEPLYHNAVPSEEEYIDAVESLFRFYEYFLYAMYE